MKEIKFSILVALLIVCSCSQKKSFISISQILSASYDYSKDSQCNSQLIYNDTTLILLNHLISHQKLESLDTTLEMWTKGKKAVVFGELKVLNKTQTGQLKIFSFDEISRRNNFLKFAYKNKEINCTCNFKNGSTYVVIESEGKSQRFKVTDKDLNDTPKIWAKDITGDEKPEIFVFLPTPNYWDINEYIIKVYEIKFNK